MIRYLLALIVTLAACFGLQTLALHLCGGSTLKSESNYFSSIARIQSASGKNAPIMLIGSSLTGRLADRGGHHPEVVNIGCDGSSAMIALRALDRGQIKPSPLIIIETNTLGYAMEGRGREIAQAIDTPGFRIGQDIPNLGATARPAAFAYSLLMARSVGRGGDTLALTTQPVQLVASPQILSTPERQLVEELTAILSRLREKGSRILLIKLPAGKLTDDVLKNIPTALAARTGLPYWDLNLDLPEGAVGYTDGAHLDGQSAVKVMNTLLQYAATH